MNQISRTIELPLSRQYVRQWGVAEAVRELLQNAIDSDSPLEYSFMGDTLTIASRDVTLDARTLILGNTSKADDDSAIGSFGEGYKLALLVLAREEYKVKVRNGYVDWYPEFRHSDTYGDEVLCIDECPAEVANFGLEFVVSGLSHTDTTAIYDSCLLMQPLMEDAIKTPKGDILPSRPGKLYVGGLYVCDTDLAYGYNVMPEFITLERDRQTVSDWDIKNQTKEMWFSTQRWDEIAEKMDSGLADLQYAEYGCPELVKEACYRRFTEKNPGAIIVNSQKEMEAMVAKGMTHTVYAGSSGYYHAVSTSANYKTQVGHTIRVATPKEFLEQWAEQNQRIMSHPLRIAFKSVIAKSAKWKET